jgi:hypothetical protein
MEATEVFVDDCALSPLDADLTLLVLLLYGAKSPVDTFHVPCEQPSVARLSVAPVSSGGKR